MTQEILEQRLVALLRSDARAMEQLALVRRFGLPQGMIAAGFVRNRVWDALAGRQTAERELAESGDVDVLYFDPGTTDEQRDWALDEAFAAAQPGVAWQVRNQARMHRRHGDAPYGSCVEAMRHWLETATAVGVWLDADNRIALAAPWGLEDLFSFTLRATPAGRQRLPELMARIEAKGWRRRWPGLHVVLA